MAPWEAPAPKIFYRRPVHCDKGAIEQIALTPVKIL